MIPARPPSLGDKVFAANPKWENQALRNLPGPVEPLLWRIFTVITLAGRRAHRNGHRLVVSGGN